MKDLRAIQSIHDAIASAVWKDFSDISYETRDWKHYHETKQDKRVECVRRPTEYDVEVMAMFPQQWGSTALGFPGIGGAAMTTAYTIVLHCELTREYCVYFGGQFAYKVASPRADFFLDVQHKRMTHVRGYEQRYLEHATESTTTGEIK